MKISEHDVESKVVKYARDKGVLIVKQTHAGARSHPDRAFYFSGGRLLQIEFKAPGAKPTVLQSVTIKKLIDLEYTVLIVDDVADGIAIVDFHLEYDGETWATEFIVGRINKALKVCDKVLARKHKPEPKVVHGRFIKR